MRASICSRNGEAGQFAKKRIEATLREIRRFFEDEKEKKEKEGKGKGKVKGEVESEVEVKYWVFNVEYVLPYYYMIGIFGRNLTTYIKSHNDNHSETVD